MPKYSIPDRWTDYNPFLSVIKDTRFLPFKVPLKNEICRNIEPESRFTPTDFLDRCEEKSFTIGLVIDLTFTTRYYDYNLFEERGIKYEKIATGGGMIPDDSVTGKFCSVVKDFLSTDTSDSLIAVHCTHGVNRTGYIICHYMITQMHFDIEKAIQSYADARGYPIERPNYLCGLRELNGSASSSSKPAINDERWFESNRNRPTPYCRNETGGYIPNPRRKAQSSWRYSNYDDDSRSSFYTRRSPYDRPNQRPYRCPPDTSSSYYQPSRSSVFSDWRIPRNANPAVNEQRFSTNWRPRRGNPHRF